MPLGIKPTVDFAFKKIFGSPQNSDALVGLLNAILEPEHFIDAVELLNPFSYQDFAESKLIVLDVRCRDATGRLLNVEMQVSVGKGLFERLVHYACRMYVDQLASGQDYAKSGSAISICLLEKPLFCDTDQAHHRFQLADLGSGRWLEHAVEVHTVEMSKYNLSEGTIRVANPLHQWVFFLTHAQHYDAWQLRRLLPGTEFESAIDVIASISAKTEDRQMYDQREKALRDYEWALASAREEGREEGRQEAWEEARQEGALMGRIQTLQEFLGDPVSDSAELGEMAMDELKSRWMTLQQRIRDRQGYTPDGGV